ncbi:hypothetical protein [Streptomyces buecherae]|uniref:hypothetical protein n=1 Tax=Streptomyces buecherae TaxID=2763006 RepID=UPI00164DA31D|nr:hypothetical protein [Streptomyces buecherae]MBC3982423.1 hypothetical protein [Streptomyces buecherae]MBC3990173.1 hypothetical protein [Streptomyces buecherae]QNJ40250.1 hypothetical protein H7H31_10585 [Streptomyces buecherae]
MPIEPIDPTDLTEPIDPTDPEHFPDEEPTTDTDGDRSVEAPEADSAEQRAALAPDRDEQPIDLDPTTANPADVAEQHRIVETDEEDYR